MNRPHPPAHTPALRYLWRHHRAGVIGFALALVFAAGFAVRLVVLTVYWSDPAHRDQPVAGWMTPGYVAQSWDVPPDVIRAALDLPQGARAGLRATLTQIAETQAIPLPELTARIEAAIAIARADP